MDNFLYLSFRKILAIVFASFSFCALGCSGIDEFADLFSCNSDDCLKCANATAKTLNVDGCWLLRDKKGEPETVVGVFDKNGVCAVKMLAIYHNGKIDDTIQKPIERAKGIKGNPPLCGLDFAWNLKESKGKYVGSVVNPDDGKIYSCKLWFDTKKSRLVLRGELFVFGENEYLEQFDISKLPFKISISELKSNPPFVK